MATKPTEGMHVRVYDAWTDTIHYGHVQAVLDTQFTYVEDGQTYYCPYNGEWQEVTDEPLY